ncbi:MAG: rhodanese-like domain-containing protein [Oligoflexales bacterium]
MAPETLLKDLKIKYLSTVLDQCFHIFPCDHIDASAMSVKNLAEFVEKPLLEVSKVLHEQLDLQLNAEVNHTDLLDSQDDVIWVDVRQKWEWQQGSFRDSYWLWEQPMKSLLIEWKQQKKKVVMMSNDGQRSFAAAMGWRSEGFLNVQSLAGGFLQKPQGPELYPRSFVK